MASLDGQGKTEMVVLTPEEMAEIKRAIEQDRVAIEALGPYVDPAERSGLQRHLDATFAPKDAPRGCETCGRIYQSRMEGYVERATNPCCHCLAAED